jgi:hypothetical protein
MASLSWYGLGALALIGVFFYFVRKIPAYVALCSLTVLGFAFVTFPLLDRERPSEWVVMTTALMLCIFGLLIVRVMLIRSVSLRLLRSIQEGHAERMNEDIGGRLADMRAFRLIETREGLCELTPFGRLVGGGIAAFYSLLRIAA